MYKSIEETIAFIKEAHNGQVDKSGEDYWKHPYAVMLLLKDATEEEKHAVLLHDVVEDTDCSFDDLKSMGYSENIIEVVALVTKMLDSPCTYMEWIEYIKDSGNQSAVKIKIANIKHNLSPKRLDKLPESMKGISKRYKKALFILEK